MFMRRKKGEPDDGFTLFTMNCVSYSAAPPGTLCAGALAVVSLLLATVLAFASTFAHRGSPLLDWGGSARAVHVVFLGAGPRAGGHDAIGR